MQRLLLFLSLLAGFAFRAGAQAAPPFAKGADVSWVTQMEQAGYRFYAEGGAPQDLFQVLQGYEMNTIRLRMWVNPAHSPWPRARLVARSWCSTTCRPVSIC